jgi:hypothetical protein
MRVMVLVKATKDSEAGVIPTTEMLTAMGKFNDELIAAGIMLDGEGLHPSSKAKRVRYAKNGPTVVDGPFAETKELVAGYWVWNVKSIDDAVDWAKRCPMLPGDEIEIRPMFSAEDFGAAMTPELHAQEARQRAAVEQAKERSR